MNACDVELRPSRIQEISLVLSQFFLQVTFIYALTEFIALFQKPKTLFNCVGMNLIVI